ncbi:class D beta-lactamase [Thalassotalea sp. G2M2-11]|uniref:class D beta-lactamase n=1 Tax=Thalassotalea sp. G2M2-11 TaxID=2787627 RepID=UPI0019D2CD96|nr:class D beta-lactamase [Thalassotalea sp. G2M2-11]
MMSLNISAADNNLCLAEDNDCTFVLLTHSSNELVIVNQARAEQALSPFSTFKIANSAIGLETGVINDAGQTLSYDDTAYPPQAWWPSVWKLPKYNLTSAYKFSMVAIYRQLAKDIGDKQMRHYLKTFNYGNQDISSGLDNFWLNGSMKISALEQVKFLQQLHQNQLALSEKTQQELRKVMLAKMTDDYRIYAKTGAGKVDDGSMLGWYVGIVETADESYYFALNFNRPTYQQMKADRIALAMNHLKQAGVID